MSGSASDGRDGRTRDTSVLMQTGLPERIELVKQRVLRATEQSGRSPDSVRIIAASKRRTPLEIQAALRLGIASFGENYVPELIEKAQAVPEAEFHFIGHLQRNKAKKLLAAGIRWVHTVDTIRLATTIQRQAPSSPIHTMLQVNIGGEASKSGVVPEDAFPLADAIIRDCPDVNLCGLMTLPPKDNDPTRWFTRLASLRDELQQRLGVPFTELSMGMSGDLEEAIACGSTMVRVGTAIFGPRPE